MKSLTWLKYEFTAELRPLVVDVSNNLDTYPATGDFVNFTYRSNNSTTIRILAPEAYPIDAALVTITDRDGKQLFADRTMSSVGDVWVIYHVEPIYDHMGNFLYFRHMAKRQS